MEKRRDFIKKMVITTAGIAAGSKVFATSAKSYRNIIGANERLYVAVIGVNGRGGSMAGTFAKQKDTRVDYLCDVDSRTFAKALKSVADAGQADAPHTEGDCRKIMGNKHIDAIYIATPDHWHAPLAIMGCQANKHVYVEKPLSHNPNEGELAITAARKYNKIVQMGAQRRSDPILMQGMEQLHKGIIGRVYFAKAWYTNNRQSIGVGKKIPVPATLNWELWQGPGLCMNAPGTLNSSAIG